LFLIILICLIKLNKNFNNIRKKISLDLHLFLFFRMNLSDNKSVRKESDILFNVENLNRQFASVFVDEPALEYLPAFQSRTNAVIDSVIISTSEVLKYLSKNDPNNSQGPDGMHPLVFRNATSSLHVPIAIIFKQSLDKRELPQAWLDENVTPLHKKGSKLDPANYRPISLTSILVKILEKIVKATLMQHLTSHKFLSDNQHDFVNHKACVTNLLETVDFLTSHHAEKIPTDLVLLDFAKAFDKVPHKRLILKLERYGIRGKLLNWIQAFLSNRKQRVCLGNNSSGWVPVTSSVPLFS